MTNERRLRQLASKAEHSTEEASERLDDCRAVLANIMDGRVPGPDRELALLCFDLAVASAHGIPDVVSDVRRKVLART